MIEATKERLQQLKDAYQEQIDTLPEYSAFGTKNDLDGMRIQVEFIQWVIDNFNDKALLESKAKKLLQAQNENDDDITYDRLLGKEEVLTWVDGKDDTIYRDNCGD